MYMYTYCATSSIPVGVFMQKQYNFRGVGNFIYLKSISDLG